MSNETETIMELQKENEKLRAENEKLIIDQLNVKDICVQMAKKLINNGKEQMGYHILAQIDETDVFCCGNPYSRYISKEKIYKKIDKLMNKKTECYERAKEAEKEKCIYYDRESEEKELLRITGALEALQKLVEEERSAL